MNITVDDMSLVLRALTFAAQKHKGKKRKDKEASPYINHLIEAAEILWNIGKIHNSVAIAAGILHDTLEDTDTSGEELEAEFGGEISTIVQELTDDKSLPNEERKRLQVEHAKSLSLGARLVKLADKISNIQDIVDSPPEDWSIERRKEYVEWGGEVINELRGTNEYLERYFDDLCNTARLRLKEDEERDKLKTM
ncbi:HD domain-containing protein [Candidatus Latescibacterota bacterium]